MNCPNCKKPFVVEQGGKFQCFDCGWFEQVDNEWRNIDAPIFGTSPEPGPEPEPVQEPSPESELSPAALEPNPAALEPNPAAQEPSPEPPHSVKEYLGGLITITEVDE